MLAREFHDAVVDRISRTGDEIVAECSMVSVYDGDVLVRQESGTLRIQGSCWEELAEPDSQVEAAFDDASILELEVANGAVTLLLEWKSYSSKRREVMVYCRRLGSVTWDADDGSVVALG